MIKSLEAVQLHLVCRGSDEADPFSGEQAGERLRLEDWPKPAGRQLPALPFSSLCSCAPQEGQVCSPHLSLLNRLSCVLEYLELPYFWSLHWGLPDQLS